MSSSAKNRHLQAAKKFLDRDQKKRALGEFEKALALDGGDIRTRLRVAELNLRSENVDEAVDGFIHCARHYEDAGSINKARTVVEQVLQLLPDRVELYVALADLELKTGDPAAARQNYRQALRVLDEVGDPSGKLDVIRCMLQLDPDNVQDQCRLAESFFAAGRTEDGVDMYRRVLETDLFQEAPTNEALRKAYQRIAERYLFHQPHAAPVAKKLALSYLQSDEAARALPMLRLAYRETPHDLQLLGVLAEAFDQLGQIQKSVAIYKEMARLFERAGLETERDRCFRNVLRLNPTDRSIRSQLGELESEVSGRTIQFESGPLTSPAAARNAPPVDSVFGPPPVPRSPPSPAPPLPDDEIEIGFEDGIEHTIVDPSFISAELLATLDKSPALKVSSPQEHLAKPQTQLPKEDLRELDFYINNGLTEDARATLAELQAAHGDLPELLERLQLLAPPS